MSNFLLGMLVMWFIYPMVKMSRKIVATKFHAYMATETEDVVVLIYAKHLCVASRGIKDDTSETFTAYYGGYFQDKSTKTELFSALQNCFTTALLNSIVAVSPTSFVVVRVNSSTIDTDESLVTFI